jgi:CRISPR-associated protein Csd1
MNWILTLAETYDNCQPSIGYSNQNGARPLLPICHITTQAHIEIVINGEGEFRRARLITDKADSTTIIPSTEGSASRAGSKPENHPLCDKLQYIAGDFTEFGGSVTSGFAKIPAEPYLNYVETLSDWCASEPAHPKAIAVLRYVTKKTVMQDLVNHQILLVDSNRQLLSKEDADRDRNAKDIFSLVNAQDDAFVRWVVENDETESRVWRDETLWESWIKHYLGNRTDKSLCYVTGKNQVVTGNHPKYIRWEGDGAKLISANDTSGFTFRGRFTTDQQAVSIGLEISHKAHYALLWLISRQGYRKGELAVVAWATSGVPIPQPTDDPCSLLFGDTPTEERLSGYTAQEIALQLKKRIAGYGKELGDTSEIAVIALDSATTGRMAIIYYRELESTDFLQRIDRWHESCAWLHRYRMVEVRNEQSGKTSWKVIAFIGAPAPHDIAEAAYGSRLDDNLRKATIGRILPCIVDGQPLPRDLLESTVRRASNRAGLEEWEWNKALSIACALFRKYNTKETYGMALDPTRTTRDYLYGRLLALADSLEEWALNEAGEQRQTNAARLMQRFAERPYSTWRTIELSLTPYKARLGGKSWKRQQMMDEVVASFEPKEFISDKRLSGEFLLGYHSQREFLRSSRTKEENQESESTTNQENAS